MAWPTGTALAVEGGAAAIALDVHFQNGCMMDEAIDGGERHGLIREHLAPFAERLIGRDPRERRSYRAAISSNSTLVSA